LLRKNPGLLRITTGKPPLSLSPPTARLATLPARSVRRYWIDWLKPCGQRPGASARRRAGRELRGRVAATCLGTAGTSSRS